MQQIADAAGVSRMAVSLALRNSPKISAATTTRIRKIALELGYRPNPLVSALMTQLRHSHPPKGLSAIAYVTADATADGWRRPGPFVEFFEGARQRAEALGYTLEQFWLRAPGMNAERLSGILQTRSVQGMIVAPLPPGGVEVAMEWGSFASATIGYSLGEPRMHRASNDQYGTMLAALRELRKLGYRRIGMAMRREHDERVKHRWSAAMLVDQQTMEPAERVPPLLDEEPFGRPFEKWFQRHRPDAVVSMSLEALEALKAMGLDVPGEVGFAHLALGTGERDWAGMRQNSVLVGAACLDLVDAQLRNNERGLPDYPKTLLVPGSWVAGPTVRKMDAVKGARGARL